MKKRIGGSAALALFSFALVAGGTGCTRDEGEAEGKKKPPIQTVLLPTVPAKPGESKPAGKPEAPAAKPTTKPTAAGEAKAPAGEAKAPAAEPTKPASEAPAPAPTVALVAGRGVVDAGVDLLAEPSETARVRGSFEGRTKVEVLREQAGFSLIRAPLVDGGAVEGWVVSSKVRPEEKVVAKAPPAAPAEGAPPKAAKPAKPAAPGEAPPKAAAPAKPAASPAKAAAKGNGPNDILLVPIAGTEKKRPATPFTHKKHWDDYSIKCVDCHHKIKALGNIDPPKLTCAESGCHTANECNNQPAPKKNKACPNFEDAYHTQCIDCHKKDGGPTKCAECHTG